MLHEPHNATALKAVWAHGAFRTFKTLRAFGAFRGLRLTVDSGGPWAQGLGQVDPIKPASGCLGKLTHNFRQVDTVPYM